MNEARDLGEINRFSFYDHMKAYTAAPPDVLRVDEKNLREHSISNCCGVIITTNHKADGIYLPADDRRHYVAWSDLTKEDFTDDYWNNLWGWYEDGGIRHVAAYLAELDLSAFDPKAPPPKTAAFWAIVDANRAPEDAELADVLDGWATPTPRRSPRSRDEAIGDFCRWIKTAGTAGRSRTGSKVRLRPGAQRRRQGRPLEDERQPARSSTRRPSYPAATGSRQWAL